MADTTTAFTQIAYDVADRIATITLDRPDQLNAFTGDDDERDDRRVRPRRRRRRRARVVVVTGRGRGFCAGADLSSGGDTFDSEDARAGASGSGSPARTARTATAAAS